VLPLLILLHGVAGCKVIPVSTEVRGTMHADVVTDNNVRSDNVVRGAMEIKQPPAIDPGEMTATSVRSGNPHAAGARIALIDIDGLLLNHNYGHQPLVCDNPLASFREKLEAAARDPQVVAVVLRINSPGGSVTACDVMAEELERFRAETHKPVVSCMMDLATSGACLVAVEADCIVAHPTSLTAGLGVIFNHYHLKKALDSLGVRPESVKSGDRIDMGSITDTIDDETLDLIKKMVEAYRVGLETRIKRRRPGMTEKDLQELRDGRVILAPAARDRHLVDQVGYVHEAICQAEQLAGVSGAEVVLYHRTGYPARSLYSIVPASAPISHDLIPFSYPGLDRSKLPAFLYMWQPDPTLPRLGSH
jgi:protease-4